MEKSLLSAEDIFAMKKDGECAIVVKGTQPLYQMKCRMENTDFVKLLCRKNTPYDPHKRNKRRKQLKATINKMSPVLVGEFAREEASKLREKGVKIIKMNECDAEKFCQALSIGMKLESAVITPKMAKQIEENTRRYQDERAEKLDYAYFKNSDAKDMAAEEIEYKARMKEVLILANVGYSVPQIKSFRPLLFSGMNAKGIMEMFGVNENVGKIKELVEIVG